MHDRYLFGRALRITRQKLGWPPKSVARDLHISEQKLYHLEVGRFLPRPDDAERIDEYFSMNGVLIWLAELSRAAQEKEPWGSLLENELLASAIRIWEHRLVPGILQIRDYAMVLLGDEHLVEERMARRTALFERENPPDVRVIISEAALRAIIGSKEVTRGQLEFLADGSHPWTLHVFPQSAPVPPIATTGPVTLLDVEDTNLVFVQGWRLDGIFDGPVAVREAWQAWDHVLGLALSPDQSTDMITSLIGEFE